MLANAYWPGKSFLHLMDARAKAIVLTSIVVASLLPARLAGGVALALTVLLVAVVATRVREAFRPVRAALPLLAFVVVLTPLFYPEGTVYLRLAGRPILTDRGVEETVRRLCRLLALIEAFSLYFRTTELDVLIASARWFGLPYGACLTLGVAARLVPSTASLYTGILEAHSLRHEPRKARRNPFAEVRRLFPVVGAVLVHSVKSIPVLSMALEARGVGRANPRTSRTLLGPPAAMVRDLVLGLLLVGAPFTLALL